MVNRRYLFGPVSDAHAEQLLGASLRAGQCLAFDTAGSFPIDFDEPWEAVAARLPAEWSPDFIALYLPYRRIPCCLWTAPIPIVALAADWNLQWHYYRRVGRHCELVLTDAQGVETFQREGIAHAHHAVLFGLEQSWLEMTDPSSQRDIDILFIGNFHPAIQAERLPWLARVAALSERWNVVIRTQVQGADYQQLMRRSRVVFNRSIRSEANKRTFETAAAGALLFQEADNLEIRDFFRDGHDCVLYTADNLEPLLHHYLENEDARQHLARAAQECCRNYSFENLWRRHLAEIDAIWPEIVTRRANRTATTLDCSTRIWQAAGATDAFDQQLLNDAQCASEGPDCLADVENLAGVARVLSQSDGGAVKESLLDEFRKAVAKQPAHLLARLNLAIGHALLGQRQAAITEARAALAFIAENPGRLDLDCGGALMPNGFDQLRVEWEKAAFVRAGNPKGEQCAKATLIQWRLHALLAELTGSLSHHYEAVLQRPDLARSRCALAEVLMRQGHAAEAIPHWQDALSSNPFDYHSAQRLFETLAEYPVRQRRLAFERRLLRNAAPNLIPGQDWYLKTPPPGEELASIIVLCCNELDYTKLCLESVLRHTRVPYELILVDNGSTDETPQYLESLLARAGPQRVKIIRNAANVGFARGCNQALEKARGSYLVFLNNDTIVTPAWLENLVAWSFHDWPHVGMVGPLTNYAAAPQQIPAGYTDLKDLDEFALRRGRDYSHKALRHDRLIGFCLLLRRDVFKAIGGFDERYGLGFFEDDDLSVRVRRAGYSLLIALNVYIHHFGSRTIAHLGIDCEQKLRDNLEIFKQKWGEAYAAPYRLPSEQLTAAIPRTQDDTPSVQLERADSLPDPAPAHIIGVSADTHHSRVSLTMIVKNEEHHLPACLATVADLVDEIIVVDTGSTDSTVAIAESSGAKVFHFPWVDNFAAARNEALRHATGDWIFWMDADDRLDVENGDKLRALIAQLPRGDVVGFNMKVSCLPGPESETATVVDHIRLFPNHPQIRWKYRVHEQILVAIRKLGGTVQWSDIVIKHVGYQDAEVHRRKGERNLRLLRLDYENDPNDPYTLFNLGNMMHELGEYQEAIALLTRSLQKSLPGDSIVRKLYSLIVQCHKDLGQHEIALATCREGRNHYPNDVELLFVESNVLHKLGDRPGAIACLQKLQHTYEDRHFASVDSGLHGRKTNHNLAVLFAEEGRPDDAEEHWRLALSTAPKFLPAWLGLADLYLKRKQFTAVETVVEQLQQLPHGRLDALILKGQLHLAGNEFSAARTFLERAVQQAPQSVFARLVLSRLFLQEGRDWEAAEQALRDVLALDPHHAEARNNLAVLLNQNRPNP